MLREIQGELLDEASQVARREGRGIVEDRLGERLVGAKGGEGNVGVKDPRRDGLRKKEVNISSV